jgi:hypothetical protein
MHKMALVPMKSHVLYLVFVQTLTYGIVYSLILAALSM